MSAAAIRLAEWRRDTAQFARECCGYEPDAWQLAVFDDFDNPKDQRIAMQACAGPGKAQPVTTLIPTPSGMRRFGDLLPGDEVFAEDGTPTRVRGVYRRGVLPTYRVTFDDGTSTLACGEHLWKVRGRTERRYAATDKTARPERSVVYSERNRTIQGLTADGYSVCSTEDIVRRMVQADRKRRQFEIPRAGAAQYAHHASLPLDPYVLGVWLGDGTRKTGTGSWRDAEIDAEVVRRGYRVARSNGGKNVTVYGITGALREVGVFALGSHERFVPDAYKFASVSQRQEVLAGLLDTDGSIAADGHITFAVTSERLVADVEWLVRSLGGIARRGKTKAAGYRDASGKRVDCRPCYRVSLTLPFNPFRLSRKSARWKCPQDRYLTRYIDTITSADAVECLCIEVEHPSHCYLTNDFIVTHNTRVLATLGWKFLTCYGGPDAHPNGFALSISGDNLKDNLWKELAVVRNGSPFLQAAFEWTSEKVFAKDHPDTWWLKARAYSKSADPETQGNALSGLHAKNILYLLDESGDMNPAVLRKAEQGLSNCQWGKIVMAGNPTSTSGALYHAVANQGDIWSVTRINGDPDDPNRSPRIDIEWAREQIRLYGRDNPWVQSYILGQFPQGGLNTLLTPDEVRTAMGRNPSEADFAFAQKRLGIDVARFGDDRTVIFPRQGVVAMQPIVLRKLRTDFITAQVLNAKRSFESEIDFIDDTGHWGHGVVDGLLSAGQGAQPVIFSDPAINPRYFNRRTEMWFEMADWVKSRGALPNIPELIPELTQPMYGFKSGKILLEDKDQIKKRLQRSPDLADALALTFAWPDRPSSGGPLSKYATAHKAVTQYDPHAEFQK